MDILIINNLLCDWAIRREKTATKCISLLANILPQYNLLSGTMDCVITNRESVISLPLQCNDIIEKTISVMNQVVTYSLDLVKYYSDQKKERSIDFNVFYFFKIGETLHSRLLAFLLDPNETHGQKRLFLHLFLKIIGIKKPEEGIWHLTREEGRIDVMLRRKDPYSVIIIENKSNWASDQPNQIYRYWYTWIYPKDGINGDRESFRIIYLPPSEYKRPVEHSLCRPNNFAHKLPNKITEGILDCCSFDKLIVQWLDECIDSVKKNDRLREYLLQYRQYCQNL